MQRVVDSFQQKGKIFKKMENIPPKSLEIEIKSKSTKQQILVGIFGLFLL